MQDVNNIVEYYENLDTTDFPVVEPNVLKKLKQRKVEYLESQQGLGLEKDVVNWLIQQNAETKQAVNGLLKNLMQVQNLAHV